MRYLSTNPIDKKTKNKSQPSDKNFTLKNGEYIGIIDNIIYNKRKIRIQHGPFKIEGEAVNDEVLKLIPGDKVLFKIRQDKITVEPYIHTI